MTPAEIQRAANSARQFVRNALDLQSLHAVLSDLESKENFVSEIEQRIAAKQAEFDAAGKRVDAAIVAAASAEGRAAAQFDDAIAAKQSALTSVTAEVTTLEARRDALRAELEQDEQRLKRTREALARAAAAVG